MTGREGTLVGYAASLVRHGYPHDEIRSMVCSESRLVREIVEVLLGNKGVSDEALDAAVAIRKWAERT